MTASPWTPALDAALRDLRQSCLGSNAIAAQLNARFGTTFTRNAVIGRASRIGAASANPPGPTDQTSRRQDELWLARLCAPDTAPAWQVSQMRRIMAADVLYSNEPRFLVVRAYAPRIRTVSAASARDLRPPNDVAQRTVARTMILQHPQQGAGLDLPHRAPALPRPPWVAA